jgi:hypothetical protein
VRQDYDYLDVRVRTFEQSVRGLPVLNGFLAVEYDDKTREVSKLFATFLPDRGLPGKSEVTSAQAEKQVLEIVSSRRLGCMPGLVTLLEGPTLGYYVDRKGTAPPRLAWVARMNPDDEKIYLNAMTGAVIARELLGIPLLPCR